MTYETVTSVMVQALREQIEVIKKDVGSRQIPHQSGIRQGAIPGCLIYSFLLVRNLFILDDTTAHRV